MSITPSAARLSRLARLGGVSAALLELQAVLWAAAAVLQRYA